MWGYSKPQQHAQFIIENNIVHWDEQQIFNAGILSSMYEDNIQEEEFEISENENRRFMQTYELDYQINYEMKTLSGDLKTLVEKNPIIIVYKPITEENGESIEENIKSLNDQIRNAVAYLYNCQFIILDKNIPPPPGRYAIKHLITNFKSLQNIRVTYFIPQFEELYTTHQLLLENISTLYYYIEEAYEKQYQGTVNNALFLIQQPTMKNYNNFSAACWLHCFNQTPNDTKLKFVFFNLSDEESAENLRLWSDSNLDQKGYLYYSLLNLHNDSLQRNFISLQEENFSNRITLIPYKNQSNILTMRLLNILMNDFFYQQIESFHPENIALNIKFSDMQKYQPEALQLLIQTLAKLSFNRLLIYLQFDDNVPQCEKDKQYQIIVNAINICYYSFQRRKIKVKEDLTEIQNIKFYFEVRRMAELYQKLMPKILSQMLLVRCNIYKTSIKKALEKLKKEKQNNEQLKEQLDNFINEEDPPDSISHFFSLIFYKQGNRLIIISAILQDQDFMDQNTKIIISYSDNLIILNQLTQNQEDKKFLYIFDIQKALASQNIVQNHKFQKIPLPNDNIYQYEVFYLHQRVYLIYGKRDNNFSDTIYYIDINHLSDSWKLLLRQQIPYKKEKLVLQYKSEKKELIQNSNYSKIKENREGFSICCFPSDQSDICLLLFGGEDVNQPQIMNVIEQINITTEGYQSFVLNKELVFKKQSFKPSRNQAILESDCTMKDNMYYLFLPFNENLIKNKFNQPLSVFHHRDAILLKIIKSEANWLNCKINYCNQEYYPIECIQDINNNVELLKQNEAAIIWKIVFTRAYKKQDFINLRSKYSYQYITSPAFQQTIKENTNIYLQTDFFQQKNRWMEKTALVQQEGSCFYLNPSLTERIAQEDQIFVVAIENYVKLDLVKNEIFIRQFSYELESSITINQENIAQSLSYYENQTQTKK